MTGEESTPSARQTELLELAYRYALEHSLAELTLRPLARAIGSSPRVLLYLFGSKDGLVRALLARARADELELLDRMRRTSPQGTGELAAVAAELWAWLAAKDHRALLTLWVEGYARSLTDSGGPWAGFARATVEDWLTLLSAAQPPAERDSTAGQAKRTLVLAVLRGALLDLLATGDADRAAAAVHQQLEAMRGADAAGPARASLSGRVRRRRPAVCREAKAAARALVAPGRQGCRTAAIPVRPPLARALVTTPRAHQVGFGRVQDVIAGELGRVYTETYVSVRYRR